MKSQTNQEKMNITGLFIKINTPPPELNKLIPYFNHQEDN